MVKTIVVFAVCFVLFSLLFQKEKSWRKQQGNWLFYTIIASSTKVNHATRVTTLQLTTNLFLQCMHGQCFTAPQQVLGDTTSALNNICWQVSEKNQHRWWGCWNSPVSQLAMLLRSIPVLDQPYWQQDSDLVRTATFHISACNQHRLLKLSSKPTGNMRSVPQFQ